MTAHAHDAVVSGANMTASDMPAEPKAKKPSTTKGAAAGAAAGAEIGSVIPVIGTTGGAVVGAAGGAHKASKAKRAANRASRYAGGGGTPRKLLVAEFLCCVVVVGLSPLGGKHKGEGFATYAKRGAAVMALFFILALISAGGKGPAKVAAAFGGVVALALLVSSRDELTALAGLVGNGGANAAAAGQGVAGAIDDVANATQDSSTGGPTADDPAPQYPGLGDPNVNQQLPGMRPGVPLPGGGVRQ